MLWQRYIVHNVSAILPSSGGDVHVHSVNRMLKRVPVEAKAHTSSAFVWSVRQPEVREMHIARILFCRGYIPLWLREMSAAN